MILPPLILPPIGLTTFVTRALTLQQQRDDLVKLSGDLVITSYCIWYTKQIKDMASYYTTYI